LNLRLLATSALILSICVLLVNVPSQVDASRPADEVPFICTSNPSLSTSGGSVQVYFDDIELTQSSPQTCEFNVHAKASVGLSITELIWDFGDGTMKQVPYCCQNQVSEIQYHAYNYSLAPQTYVVTVVAYDNMNNFGYVRAVVNWSTPVPEYSNFGIALLLSMLLVPVLVRRGRAVPA